MGERVAKMDWRGAAQRNGSQFARLVAADIEDLARQQGRPEDGAQRLKKLEASLMAVLQQLGESREQA